MSTSARTAYIPLFVALLALIPTTAALAADVINNGDFQSDLSAWTTVSGGAGTVAWDGTWGGAANGSASLLSPTGRNTLSDLAFEQSLGSLSPGQTVALSFAWYKDVNAADPSWHDIEAILVHPDLTETIVWSHTTIPTIGGPLFGSVNAQAIGGSINSVGTHKIKFRHNTKNGRSNSAWARSRIDDVIVDVAAAGNAVPTIAAGATSVSPVSIVRAGANAVTLSATFGDSDQPGIGAFTVTFQVREPDNATVVAIATAAANGTNGVTITDNGGGSYTATVDWDPGASQPLGVYDLYFQVSDGTDIATDDFNANPNELTLLNAAPTLTADTTLASPASVEAAAASATTLTANFSDADQPGIGAFLVTFKVREPDNATEVIIVNASVHGANGVTITDSGGGNYSAFVDWDPGISQALGAYDLYFEVSDGTDNVIDGYTPNADELTLLNTAPALTPDVTAASPASIQAVGTSSTTLSATFSDANQPGIGAFLVTFKVREPNNSTEVTLVTASAHGTNGVTVVDNGGGSYTASLSWDPGDAQTVGLYDLYFEVSDGIDNVVDGYTANSDELTLTDPVPNEPPVVSAGATNAAPASIYVVGAAATTLSATFTDADVPGVGAFSVSFLVRQPDNVTTVAVVTSSGHGVNGVSIIDNGGGSYTASVSYNPADSEPAGLYDLRFEVSDGSDLAADDYANNLDGLNLLNRAPTLVSGNTSPSKDPVNRYGADSSTLSATFTDNDQPAVGSFTVTFRLREPDDTTIVSLAEGVAHGAGGVSIVDNGGGSYTASIAWDPGPAQTLGRYDLYFSVNDGSDAVVDDYTVNVNELQVVEVITNNPPVIAAGATAASPSSVDRLGASTTTVSVEFTDADGPGVGAFTIDLIAREPYATGHHDIALGLQNGQGGLTITDLGGNSYRAQITWDPPADAALGYYDLEARVSDGSNSTYDEFANNLSDLLITSGGENMPPVVQADETSAAPSAIPRVGATSTTLSATFTDADAPGIGGFTVTFKVREPDNVTEVVIANAAGHGTAGVTIADLGSGIYTASVDWDPADAQTAGLYDLFFEVSDGALIDSDGYLDNENELELFDDIANQAPTIVAGAVEASPASITRFGGDYTMLRVVFDDADQPGFGTFTVTFSVRDAASGVTTVVNAATHGFQGLRVRSLGGTSYDASVLWDPGVGQVTGLYDLSATIQDAGGLSATDGYANNTDELTVTATGVAGDGYLLRRTHNADGCGGPTSGCHDILDHQGQTCLTCHTPHGSSNIYLVRETITTPISGDKPVLLKTVGIGDANNDPDPTIGDPNSGAMADDTDGVFTGVCEVCHTGTDYHRNDGTQPKTGHHNAEDCRACHSHTEGFPRPEGNAESGGGQACSCHSGIGSGLMATDSAYHHLLSSMSADYTISSKTCLMCHVDHDIFRPDVNTGIGARAKNLRVDTTTPVVQGDSGVLSDSDYIPTGSGGICLSCHVSAQTKGWTQADGTTQTIVISKPDFDASTSSHNYDVNTTFTTDSSVFRANCVKCHDDGTATSYQDPARSIATHTTPYRRMLNPFDTASPSDPLEQNHCFGCHSTASNPNAGSNQDYFGVKTMSAAALSLQSVVGYTYAHPITSFTGRHKPDEVAGDLADGATRHVECTDCHNVHAARAGTHDGSTNLVSNPLKGAWGVEPTSWPAAPTPSDNANVYVAPSGYTRVEPAQKEYQICLKCHSSFTTLPSGARNLAEEINPNYPSTHGIVSPGTNAYCNSTTMNEPWGSSRIAWCSDCHRSDNAADAGGAHGSNLEHMLVATITSDDAVGTPLCYVCHKSTVYWSGDAAASKYPKHPATQGAHQRPQGCFACHMWEFSSTAGLGVSTVDDLTVGQINVHGQNKIHTFNEQDGSAGSGQPVDAFVNGYLANVDYVQQKCWAEVCKGHSGQGY